MKAHINSQGQMTKMAAMAINSKKLLKLLQNQKAYGFETWHEALGEELYKIYINHGPGMTLTYI